MQIVEFAPRPAPSFSNLWLWTLGSFGMLLVWDASGLDLPLARLIAGNHGFALRDHWAIAGALHEGARGVAWLLGLWLLAGVWWPTGVLRQLSRPARVQWLLTTLLALMLISALKYSSQTSCPWDLAEFGGAGSYLSHWDWGRPDGGSGHCFPAGHASAGFAFIGGFFVLRQVSRRRAAQCLAAVLAAGAVLGLAQQLRGAHFMSHTLWTAWFCWSGAWLIDTAIGLPGYSAEGILPCHETS
jgi:membrane-associated PAP2 superfamily phosphatase